VSRSPRRNLRTALAELDDLAVVLDQHPASRQELVDAIGENLLGEITKARETIARAVERLESPA
jgi:hypothetical protein